MTSLSLIFMGTPALAVPILKRLIDSPHHIKAVYTQPPRPIGRGQKTQLSPVHTFAQDHGLEVCTPLSLKSADTHEKLRSFGADAVVVLAYGLLLPLTVLDIPRYGCFNLHVSLLPRWRGASPITQTILHGDNKTGVTLMQMDAGLDTGPIILQESLDVPPQSTTASLGDRLAELASVMILPGLEGYVQGTLIPIPQPSSGVTLAPKMTKEVGFLNWTRTAVQLEQQIRAFTPWPGSFFIYKGEKIKVWQGVVESCLKTGAAPGQVLDDQLLVACGQGALRLLIVQRPGKNSMAAADFLRGCPIALSTHLDLIS